MQTATIQITRKGQSALPNSPVNFDEKLGCTAGAGSSCGGKVS